VSDTLSGFSTYCFGAMNTRFWKEWCSEASYLVTCKKCEHVSLNHNAVWMEMWITRESSNSLYFLELKCFLVSTQWTSRPKHYSSLSVKTVLCCSTSFFVCFISIILLKWRHFKCPHNFSSARFNKKGFKYPHKR